LREKLNNDDDTIRKQGRRTNLFCGALFGVVLALGCIFEWEIVSLSWRILTLFLLPITFAGIALNYGDRFWENFPKWISWFIFW
jgi:hypothetical protein